MFKTNARHSHSARVEGVTVLFKISGDSINDTDFQLWLASKFGLNDRNELLLLLSYFDAVTVLSRCKLLSFEEQNRVYKIWKLKTEISIHQGNVWHIVKISKGNIQP